MLRAARCRPTLQDSHRSRGTRCPCGDRIEDSRVPIEDLRSPPHEQADRQYLRVACLRIWKRHSLREFRCRDGHHFRTIGSGRLLGVREPEFGGPPPLWRWWYFLRREIPRSAETPFRFCATLLGFALTIRQFGTSIRPGSLRRESLERPALAVQEATAAMVVPPVRQGQSHPIGDPE